MHTIPISIMIKILNKNHRGISLQSTRRIKSLLPAFGALNERDDEDEEEEAKNEEREEVALDDNYFFLVQILVVICYFTYIYSSSFLLMHLME